jgi:hypothetical protein
VGEHVERAEVAIAQEMVRAYGRGAGLKDEQVRQLARVYKEHTRTLGQELDDIQRSNLKKLVSDGSGDIDDPGTHALVVLEMRLAARLQ